MTKIEVASVLDQRLTNGSDDGTGTKPCVMNKVHARWLLRNGVYETGELTDLPECTDPLVARMAQVVNDRLANQGKDLSPLESEELQIRLMLAHAPADPLVARRVRVRTLIWAAESVAHLVRDEAREVCEAAVATARRWLHGEASEEDAHAAAYAVVAAAPPTAAAAAHADAAYAAHAVAAAAYAAHAAAAVLVVADADEMDLIDWLDDFLTAHEKARAVEGVLHEEMKGTGE